MFPTNSERLIGVSDAFSAFVYGYLSSCPRAHCTPNKSVPTLRHTRWHGPVGTYRVQSPSISEDRLLRPIEFISAARIRDFLSPSLQPLYAQLNKYDAKHQRQLICAVNSLGGFLIGLSRVSSVGQGRSCWCNTLTSPASVNSVCTSEEQAARGVGDGITRPAEKGGSKLRQCKTRARQRNRCQNPA